jgi:hypothetical protein
MPRGLRAEEGDAQEQPPCTHLRDDLGDGTVCGVGKVERIYDSDAVRSLQEVWRGGLKRRTSAHGGNSSSGGGASTCTR